MTNPLPPASSPRAKSLIRLLVTIEVSLAIHVAIILGIQIGSVERGAAPRPAIQARLMPVSVAQDAPAQEILVKAIDRPIKSQVADYQPPPQAMPSESPKSQSEHVRQGVPEAAASPTLVEAPLPVDPTYYPSREVDEPATWVVKPSTQYPSRAVKENRAGEVLMLLLVDEFGKVQEASVVEVKPEGFGFEEAAMASVSGVRLKPAIRKGRTVKSRVVYRVSFEP